MLSSEVHPGFGSASLYFLAATARELAGDDELPKGPANFGVSDALLLAIDSCVWAGWSIDKLFAIEHFGPVIAPIADRLDLVPLTRIQ